MHKQKMYYKGMSAGEHTKTFSFLSHAWSQTDIGEDQKTGGSPCKSDITGPVNSQATKNARTLGQRRTQHDKSSNSLQTPTAVIAKVKAFLPIHLYAWFTEKTVDTEE